MATEQELAAEAIDVFGEAFMALVRKRLRIRVSTFHPDRGKLQIQIGLEDIMTAAGQPSMIDSHSITIHSDLLINTDY